MIEVTKIQRFIKNNYGDSLPIDLSLVLQNIDKLKGCNKQDFSSLNWHDCIDAMNCLSLKGGVHPVERWAALNIHFQLKESIYRKNKELPYIKNEKNKKIVLKEKFGIILKRSPKFYKKMVSQLESKIA